MKVIEFLGMPRAGKTTAVEIAESYFKKEKAKVRTVYEGARICPLDKSERFNYNAWSFHNTVNRILEARLDNYDFILVDRGILDHISFLQAIEPLCKGYSMREIRETLNYYHQFLRLQDMEIYFKINPEEAIKREKKHKPFLGSVFDKDFLIRLFVAYENVYKWADGTLVDRALGKKGIYEIDGNNDLNKNSEKILDLCQKLLKERRKNDEKISD